MPEGDPLVADSVLSIFSGEQETIEIVEGFNMIQEPRRHFMRKSITFHLLSRSLLSAQIISLKQFSMHKLYCTYTLSTRG